MPGQRAELETVAIFGPTGAGKTGDRDRAGRGRCASAARTRSAINCDSIQVYEGLEVLSGAPSAGERARLEHRLVGFVPVDRGVQRRALRRRWPAREIDALLAAGAAADRRRRHRALSAGGAQLDRAAPAGPRAGQGAGRARARRARCGGAPRRDLARGRRRHPSPRPQADRPHARAGAAGPRAGADSDRGGELWTAALRHPTLLAGIVLDLRGAGGEDRRQGRADGRRRRGRRGAGGRARRRLAHGRRGARFRGADLAATSRPSRRPTAATPGGR